MTVYSAQVQISGTTDVGPSTTLATRIRRGVVSAASSSFAQNNFPATSEAKGKGSSKIASSSAIQIRAPSTSYGVDQVRLYYPQSTGTLEYQTNPGSGVTSITTSNAPIGAQSGVVIQARSRTHLGIDIRQYTQVRAIATVIRPVIPVASGLNQTPTITLDSGDRGITTARITPQHWSDYPGLRAGFRLSTTDGESLALFLQDPQYLSGEIQVQVIDPFLDPNLGTDNWVIDIPEGTDFNDQQYTPNYFRSSDLLSAVMKDFKKFVVGPVQYRNDRMLDLRRWDQIEGPFLGPLAKTMGLNIRLDRMDDESRRRAIHEWIPFTQYAGTQHFVDFQGFILDTVFTIEHLWTNDYRNFIPQEGLQYPAYYPTNHVAIGYDAQLYDISDPNDIQYIYDLFYTLASVPLVLEQLNGYLTSAMGLYIQAVGWEQEDLPAENTPLTFDQGNANFYLIGIDVSVEETLFDGNIMPPNFYVFGVDTEQELIIDQVTG